MTNGPEVLEKSVTWKYLIDEAFDEIGEPLIGCSRSLFALNVPFNPATGRPRGCTFSAWTPNWVLFPCINEGAETVAMVPRHPTVCLVTMMTTIRIILGRRGESY